MPACVAITCSNGYKGHNTPKDIRWFKLPTSPSLRGRWLFQIHRENEKNFNTEHARICSQHFRPDDFLNEDQNIDSKGRKRKLRRLKPTAVPTINMRPIREFTGKTSKISNSNIPAKNQVRGANQRSRSGGPRSRSRSPRLRSPRSRSPRSRSRSLDKDHDPTVDRGVGNVFEGSNETKGKFFILKN